MLVKGAIVCRDRTASAPTLTVHYDDVIMTTMASQITSLAAVYSSVYSDANQRKHQSSASLAFVWGIHRDRWIPRTKDQLRGKCFHLMTSSWCTSLRSIVWWKRMLSSSWWRHQMETISVLLALCEGNHRLPVVSIAKASDAELWFFLWSAPEQTVKRLSKQSRRRWFEASLRSLGRHCNVFAQRSSHCEKVPCFLLFSVINMPTMPRWGYVVKISIRHGNLCWVGVA